MSRKRTYGRGSVFRYKTKSGYKYRWQLVAPLDPESPNGEKRRASKSGYSTRAEAEDALSAALSRVRRRKPALSSKAKLQEVCSEWLSELDLANSTLYGYKKIMNNHIIPHLGHISIGDLRPNQVAKFYKNLKAGGRRDSKDFGGRLSANTVNKIHIVLGAMLQDAVNQGLIPDNPARDGIKVKPPTRRQIREEAPEETLWTPDQLRDFLAWDRDIKEDYLYPLWVLIALTGMRRGEVIALRWRDVDFRKMSVSIRRSADSVVSKAVKTTKTSTSRVIAVDSVTLAVLQAYRAQRSKLGIEFVAPDAFIFGTLNNELRSPNDLTARWTRLIRAAQGDIEDLPFVTLKGLRHTHATLMLQAGENPKVVQERLGHSDIQTTLNIYSHVTPTIQQESVNRFVAWLDTPSD